MLRSAAGRPLLPLTRWSVGPYTDAPAVAIPGHFTALEGAQEVDMDSLADLLGDFGGGDGDDTPRPPLTWSDVVQVERDGACAWDTPRCGACAGVESVDGVRCPCAGIVARARRLTLARIPWTYRAATLDPGGPAAAWVEAWTSRSMGLRLVGPTGTGKTHRSCALVRALCDRRVSARYVLWSEWVRRYRDAIGREVDQHGMRARVLTPDVVVLDDIGRERVTEYAAELLDEVLGGRLDDGRTMVIASNLDDAGLAEHVGDRLWSRLRGATRRAEMVGPDRRVRGGAGGRDG